MPPDSKETKFGSSNQEVSSSAGKDTRIVLVLVTHGSVSLQLISGGVDISGVPGCHLL